MRHRFPLLLGAVLPGLVLVVSPAAAQTAPDPAAQIAALREELANAQQEIVRLRAEAGNRQDLETALKAAREKNERLVAITNELIAACEKRYQRGRFLPFDAGRRKFEAALQDLGDRTYDNRWDASPRRPAAPPASGAAPAQTDQRPRRDAQ